MNKTITMTTKGTFTLPAEFRKRLNINNKGDRLSVELDEAKQIITIKKPIDLGIIHDKVRPYVQTKKPLNDVSNFYENRKPKS